MKLRHLSVLALALLIASTAVVTAKEVPTYRAPGVFDAAAQEAAQQALNAWLWAEQPNAALRAPITVDITDSQVREMDRARTQAAKKLLVGVTSPVDALVDVGAPQHGAVRKSAAGVIWTGSVHSPGAAALRLHLSDVDLPAGAQLYIYNDSGEAFGPYTLSGPRGTGDFWTHTVAGDRAMLQLRGAADDTYFRVSEVGHLGDAFLLATYRQAEAAAKSFCSFNASCVENAECGASSAVTDARDAVAHYQFIQRPYIYICSGGLIADEAQSGTPYFLTANHCVSRDRIASTVETYFFFTTPCGGSCYSPSTANTLGATILATSSTSDYTLMRLDDAAPSGAAFLGWDTSPIAYSGGANLYRISHPGGAPQAYSEHRVDTATGTCTSWPRGDWIYSEDTYGATEGGSSGSPVVNGQGLVVGQLSGACGYNLNDVCDSASNATVDGAFAAYYNQVSSILGGSTSCPDADGDGYTDASCGGTDCDDGDSSVNPGAIEVCGDSIDNNCDGTVDEGCGGGSCLPKGDPCSSGSECCSDRCHPRKAVCQ